MIRWLTDLFLGYFRDLHKFQAVPFNRVIAGVGCALLAILAVVFFVRGAIWPGCFAVVILAVAAGLCLWVKRGR